MKEIKRFSEFVSEQFGQQPKVNKAGKPWVQNADIDDLLLSAAREGDVQECARLLDQGANINAQDDYGGQTALYIAIEGENDELARFLVSKGADPNLMEWETGEGPLSLAVAQGNLPTVELLLGTKRCNKRSISDASEAAFVDGNRGILARLMNFSFENGFDPVGFFVGDLSALLATFDGDLSWASEGLRAKLQRMQRGQQAFGM